MPVFHRTALAQDIASKLVGASFDGALVFQGHLTGVSVQLKVGAATNS
jgi:hypothetical protein